MRRLQYLLLFSLMSAIHCHPGSEADQTRRVKREDEVSVNALQTLVQKQASMIDKQQAKLAACKNQLNSFNNRLDAYQNQLDSQTDSFNNRLDAYEKQLVNQADSFNNRLDAYQNQQDNQADSYKNQMDSCKNQVDSYKNQFDSYKSQVNTQLQVLQRKEDAASKSVAFTARIATSHDSLSYGLALGHHQTLIFDDVVTNIGNAYNKNNGIFTAPVNGTYVFSLHQMNPDARTSLYLAIVKNGAVLDMVYSEGTTDNTDQASSQVSTHLTAGDQVWVRQNFGTGVRAGWWTIFNGFLLHAE